MTNFYTLVDRKPVPVSLEEFSKTLAIHKDRSVANTQIGNVNVSTVFLCFDHAFGGGTPMLFESMAFGLPDDELQTRCSTWEEAEEMHKAMCEKVRDILLG